MDVDLSLNWAGTTHSRNLADDDEQDEKKDAGDDDLTDDPLFNWFVDTDNDGGGNPAASPSSSAYKSASPSPPPPPPPPRPREIDSDADSDSDDDGRPRKMVLEQYFIGSPEKDADKSNPPVHFIYTVSFFGSNFSFNIFTFGQLILTLDVRFLMKTESRWRKYSTSTAITITVTNRVQAEISHDQFVHTSSVRFRSDSRFDGQFNTKVAKYQLRRRK